MKSARNAGSRAFGVVQAGDSADAQFADEAILQGAPEAFDAALGLRGLSSDEANAEVLEHAAEVSGILLAAQFLGEGWRSLRRKGLRRSP